MDIRGLIDKLEANAKYDTYKPSKLVFNQPDRLFISSENSIRGNTTANSGQFNNVSFNNFTVNLDRPCINVKKLQLVSANIPTTSGLSFNDYELVFYYYRIRTQRNFDDTLDIYNEAPSLDNLYMVRILPSYYKPELIPDSDKYAFNKTFNTYEDLADELNKACSADLAFTNGAGAANIPFMANDISITYNESYNKFQMTGNNINNRLIPNSPPIWQGAVAYYTNDIVFYDNNFYIAILDNNSVFPSSSPTVWALYCTSENSTTKIWNTYLIAGYDDPNVKLLMGDTYEYTFPDWDTNTKYLSGTRVSYYSTDNDTLRTYKAKSDNRGVRPENTDIWQDIGESPFGGLGISGISRIYDFNYENVYNTSSLFGIPPQPYNIKKILNLKLGFTWDGKYNWIQQTNIVGFTDELAQPQLYNRLRPVPHYEIIPPEELGDIPISSSGNPFKATTFLADGYCNLVLSSTLFIYTSIIGSSTLDTIRNTSLLAIVPLNCSTLGITFTNNFIDNPLTKVNSDITSIYIEFRNESGELISLGNNGSCSFALKLEY